VNDPAKPFVSRAGLKLDHALQTFQLDVTAFVVADLGCNVGGFVDCLLRRGAARVYAVDTGYGALDWTLRKDARVVTLERTNAMHVALPEKVDLVTVDVAWTRQCKILPNARKLLKPGAAVVTLIKPHYESDTAQLRNGVLIESEIEGVMSRVQQEAESLGFLWERSTPSPIKGAKGNTELLALLRVV